MIECCKPWHRRVVVMRAMLGVNTVSAGRAVQDARWFTSTRGWHRGSGAIAVVLAAPSPASVEAV